jgi:hypothetical protein
LRFALALRSGPSSRPTFIGSGRRIWRMRTLTANKALQPARGGRTVPPRFTRPGPALSSPLR